MPAPDPHAIVTKASQGPDLLDKKGHLPPWLYPRGDIGPHVFDPCQVILDADGNVPVNVMVGSFEVEIGTIEIDPGPPEPFEDTAAAAADTYTYARTANATFIFNKSKTTELLIDIGGGIWHPVPPRASLSIGAELDSFDFKTAAGTAAFNGIASLTNP